MENAGSALELTFQYLPAQKASILHFFKIVLKTRATLPVHVLNVAKPALRHLHLDTITVEWDLLLHRHSDLGIRN